MNLTFNDINTQITLCCHSAEHLSLTVNNASLVELTNRTHRIRRNLLAGIESVYH